jgi:hypothetical protein
LEGSKESDQNSTSATLTALEGFQTVPSHAGVSSIHDEFRKHVRDVEMKTNSLSAILVYCGRKLAIYAGRMRHLQPKRGTEARKGRAPQEKWGVGHPVCAGTVEI